jgi:hypothetical protein
VLQCRRHVHASDIMPAGMGYTHHGELRYIPSFDISDKVRPAPLLLPCWLLPRPNGAPASAVCAHSRSCPAGGSSCLGMLQQLGTLASNSIVTVD